MKKAAIVLIFMFWGCNRAASPGFTVSLKGDKTLMIDGIDTAFLAGLKDDTAVTVWQQLLPVYRMPADTDMKDYQQPQPGAYRLAGNIVVFTPDTPFHPNQTYYIRYYHFGKNKTIWDAVKGKNDIRGAAFTEKIFRPEH